MQPIVLINAVGLTPRLLEHAPRLKAIAESGWVANMPEVLPAVTCTAQATLLTGKLPERTRRRRQRLAVPRHQRGPLLAAVEPADPGRAALRDRPQPGDGARQAVQDAPSCSGGSTRGRRSTSQRHAEAALRGRRQQGVRHHRHADRTRRRNWSASSARSRSPRSGGRWPALPSTQWIARGRRMRRCKHEQPDLTLVYLPHLDYDPQRFGPKGCDMPKCVKELDDACAPLLDAATAARGAGLGGERVRPLRRDRGRSTRTACCAKPACSTSGAGRSASNSTCTARGRSPSAITRSPTSTFAIRTTCRACASCSRALPGVARVLAGEERDGDRPRPRAQRRDRPARASPTPGSPTRSGSTTGCAPDYARAVAIHHKPGFDPCELFFDPKLAFPKLHAARRLLQKKLGFRMTMDVVPLDASIVRGSHGLPAADPRRPAHPDRPRPEPRPERADDGGARPASECIGIERLIPTTWEHGDRS